MKRSLKKGLPGSPNEKVFSKEGYRSTSPDVNNPFNIISSGSITMKEKDGTPLKKGPLLGIDNLGNSKLMLPGANYQFPGNFVKEVPLAKKGGQFQNSNIYATNKLFVKNPLFKKRKKGKKARGIYNPKAKYTYQPGGEIEYNQLPNNYKDALKNFVYPEVIDLPEETDTERYGYDAALGVIYQNPNDPIQNMNNPWWGEHELFHHLQNQAGAMSTYGLVGQRPNPYVASDQAIGSYYDRRGSEFDVELNKIFEQNPDISEEEAYTLAEENLYRNPTSVEGEARNYEGYIEAGNPSMFNKKAFGGESGCPEGFYNDPIKGCIAIEDPNTFYENWFQNRVMPTPEGQKLLDKIRPEALERSRESVPYIYSEELNPDEAGYYDVDTRQIMLNKFLPEAQIQATKYHERMHDIQAGDKFSNVLEKPQGYLVEQNIIEPKAINTGNPEWDKNLKKNYEDIVDSNEIHARVMTLRRLAGFRPDQTISEKDLQDYFNKVKEAGSKLDPDIEDLKGVTKGNKAIVNLLNDMVSVPSSREDLQVAKYGVELDLTEDEIKKYVDGGYIVEDISIPSLTRMDNGGNPIKQLQKKEKAAELSRLIASGAVGGLGSMANYITKAISESENKPKPSSNASPARATAKPKSLAAVEKLASAPKTKPGEVNLAVRDFVQDAKEIDLKSKEEKDPMSDKDARYEQWLKDIEDKKKNQTYLEDIGDWVNENIFGAESDYEKAYRSIYNPVKPKTYYYNGREVTGNGPWNNYGDSPVQMVYPEMYFMGPSGGVAGIASNALKSGFNYGKNVIWPALNTALPLGEGITTATAGTVTPFNIASLLFGSQSAANLADSESESRKSLSKAYNNPTTENILDAVGNVGLDALGILGSPGVTNMLGSAVSGIGNFATTKTPLKNTYKYNPWAFKPDPKAAYRMIGDEAGLRDALESGYFRPSPQGSDIKIVHPETYYTMGVPSDTRKYFGHVWDRGYPGPYMVEVSNAAKDSRFTPLNTYFGTGKDLGNIVYTNPGKFIPINEATIYKQHWLKGYKPIKTPSVGNIGNKRYSLNYNQILGLPENEIKLKTGMDKDYWEAVIESKPDRYGKRLEELYNQSYTPSQEQLNILESGKKDLIDFYSSPEYSKRIMEGMGIDYDQALQYQNNLINAINRTESRFINTTGTIGQAGTLESDAVAYTKGTGPEGTKLGIDYSKRGIERPDLKHLNIHELGHSSIHDIKNKKILESLPELPIEKETLNNWKTWNKEGNGVYDDMINYYSNPDEARQRAISSLIYAKNKGLSIDDIVDMPYMEVIRRNQMGEIPGDLMELRQIYDQSKLKDYLKKIYTIIPPALLLGVGAAAYGTNDGANYKLGGLTRMNNGGNKTIQGIEGLKEDFADRLSQFIQDAESQGINLKIGSGYRSYEKQKELWEAALKKYGSAEVARKWVAPPGSSYHNKGLAVDLHDENSRALGKEDNQEATAWAHANAKKYGLHFRLGNEPWHIEPIEFTGEDHEHTEENNLSGDILIPELQTESRVVYDDDYSDWSPNKKEAVTSDPRLEQLSAFSKIIAPSNQNINTMYQNAIAGNMKKGGFILEIDDNDIQKYLDGGFVIEEID